MDVLKVAPLSATGSVVPSPTIISPSANTAIAVIAPVPEPNNTPPSVRVDTPVPPCATAISVASQVPVAIVPILVMLVWAAVVIVPSKLSTTKVPNVNPLVVFTVVVGASWLFPVVANSFHLSESEASLKKPAYLTPLSVYFAYSPKSTESAPFPFPNNINGSSTERVAVFTVTVSPLTTKSPAIVTSSGKPIVTVPELSATVTSLLVPANVIVLPKVIAVELLPSETVTDLASTYALIDCCVANLVALLLPIASSSKDKAVKT